MPMHDIALNSRQKAVETLLKLAKMKGAFTSSSWRAFSLISRSLSFLTRSCSLSIRARSSASSLFFCDSSSFFIWRTCTGRGIFRSVCCIAWDSNRSKYCADSLSGEVEAGAAYWWCSTEEPKDFAARHVQDLCRRLASLQPIRLGHPFHISGHSQQPCPAFGREATLAV